MRARRRHSVAGEYRIEDLDDSVRPCDEGQAAIQLHPGGFERGQPQRLGELERAVTEKRVGNVLALRELQLFGGRLRAHADNRSAMGSEIAYVIPKGATLRSASASARYLIPTLRQRHPGPAGAGVDIDDEEAESRFGEIKLATESGRQHQTRDLAAKGRTGEAPDVVRTPAFRS